MKLKMIRSFLPILLLLGLLAWPGCSGGGNAPEYNKDVDVNANIEKLQSTSADERADACVAIGEAGPHAKAAMPALIATLKDRDPLVRRLAAYALGRIGPEAKEAVPALLELLRDRDGLVRSAAVGAIHEIDPQSVPAGAMRQ